MSLQLRDGLFNLLGGSLALSDELNDASHGLESGRERADLSGIEAVKDHDADLPSNGGEGVIRVLLQRTKSVSSREAKTKAELTSIEMGCWPVVFLPRLGCSGSPTSIPKPSAILRANS